MKKILTQLVAVALIAFATTTKAQCAYISGLSTTIGASGTATITPIITGTYAPGTTSLYWNIFPSATYLGGGAISFPSNGTYSVCVSMTDSSFFCPTTNSCTVVNITTAPICSANFINYTDSFCVTHFVNTSTGSVSLSNWYVDGSLYTSAPSLSLSPGLHYVSLVNYSSGAICDSVNRTINVTCSTSTCHATFTYNTDSACVTHFVNTTPCTYSVSSWNIDGVNYFSAPSLVLTTGWHLVTLNSSVVGVGVLSTTQSIYTSCPGSCSSSFMMFADSIGGLGSYNAFNTSTGVGLTYLWNFGDGTTSTLAYPSHTYSPPGHYIVCLTVSSGTTCTDTHCDSSSVYRISSGFLMGKLNVLAPTSVKELNETVSLNAYPNPMSDALTVELVTKENKTFNYSLIDALGRIVMSGVIENQKLNVSTSHLDKGFYNLSITSQKGDLLKTVKLVK